MDKFHEERIGHFQGIRQNINSMRGTTFWHKLQKSYNEEQRGYKGEKIYIEVKCFKKKQRDF